ncbi:MAG: glycoside hydrolase family 16 protein [Candidatus Nanopelagicales bacterium]
MPGTRTPARALAVVAVAVLGLTLAPGVAQAGPASDAGAGTVAVGRAVAASATAARTTYRLTWSDSFGSRRAGAPPSRARWVPDVGGHGWGNQQLEYDSADARNAHVDGRGHLVLAAVRDGGRHTCWYGPCRWSSARLTTRGTFSQRYGRFAARMKVPCGAGLWPAFWALGTDVGTVGWPRSGEIDVMEVIGRDPSTVHGTVHGPGYSGGDGVTGRRTTSAPLCRAFHVYEATWSSSRIDFALDGRVYSSATPASVAGRDWVFRHRFFLLLDLAVGGGWPGSPTSATRFPARLVVDWVRAYAAVR